MSEKLRLARDNAKAHNEASRLYVKLREMLEGMLPSSATICHVGATAVPGCLTKGDLDILVRVSPVDFKAAERILSAQFERNVGSAHTTNFAAYMDPTSKPALGIQLTVIDGPLDIFLRFTERLRNDRDLLERYNALKVLHDGKPMEAYRAAKADFIAEALAR